MGAFLYFLPAPPDKQSVSPPDLTAAGLGYVMDEGRSFTAIATSAGPNGGSGILIGFVGDDGGEPALRFNADSQAWRKSGDGKFWVGLQNDADKPGPNDLARKRVISGEPVKLRDGNEWIVPICLSIVRGSTLPQALVLGEDGQTWTLESLPEFVKLCKDAETVWAAFRQSTEKGDGKVRMDGQESPRIAADALCVNYRIGPLEISLLKLWSTNEMWDVLKVIVDVGTIERLASEQAEKKRVAAG